jgi:glycerol-3-phosphate dehydrogenase
MPSGDFALTAARRTTELDSLTRRGDTVDLLVIGLGVTGAGVALDAATRGLSVAAIDAHDLAWGTSRWSSKLVHGGLRYLARLEVGIAYESAVERAILMRRTAPHLIRPLPMVLPLRRNGLSAGAGFVAGDLLRRAAGQPSRTLPRPRRLSAVETRSAVPGLSANGLRGGLMMWEGQLIDDARLVIGLARTAAGNGARVLTRCRAERVFGLGAEVVDTLTGVRHLIRARSVVNAAGVWAGGLVPGVDLQPSRGTHIVIPGEVLGAQAGLLMPVPQDRGRFVFALPQPDGTAYVGLTDEAYPGPLPDVPEAPEADIEFLLGVLNTVLAEPLDRADVLGAFAGLRPLLAGRSARTADLSRRHAILTSPDGVITVVGGKLTTYRRMAQDAVDAAVRRVGFPAGECRTRALPLVGAAPPERLAAVDAPRRLVARYGTEALAVVKLAAGEPALLDPVAPGSPVTGVELAFGVRAEGALDVDDLLDRRTRLGLVPAQRAAAEPAARAALAAVDGTLPA